LGLHSALITSIGKDAHGTECIDALVKNKVDTQFVQQYPGLATNYHFVLWYGQERTILIKHEKFPYVIPDISSTRWFYLSSLGEHTLSFHQDLADYFDAHPDINLVFQPGTFQIKFGVQALHRLYKRTKIFFCNLEEAERILEIKSRDVKVLLAGLKALGPQIPVITDGPAGSYALDGDRVLFLPAYPDPKPPYERTGAGDAFASTFTTAIALGHSIEEAMKWGSINSMSVCQEVGAQKGLLTKEQLLHYLQTAPQNWNVTIL
jgi:ribokinase